jgi:hypothetical protein
MKVTGCAPGRFFKTRPIDLLLNATSPNPSEPAASRLFDPSTVYLLSCVGQNRSVPTVANVLYTALRLQKARH